MKTTRTTPEDLTEIRATAAAIAGQWPQGPDVGTCVTGSGVTAEVWFPRARTPRRVLIWGPTTQCEQPKTGHALVARMSELFPLTAFAYECGRMD